MTKHIKAVAIALACSMLLSGCVSTVANTGKRIFQRFEFGNDGRGEVNDVKIQYGDLLIPTGTHRRYWPNHLTGFSETLTIPVPDTADVHWVSADGAAHDATVPVRKFVRNSSCFHGFRFFFADDRLDAYVLSRTGDCRDMQQVESALVFSTVN